MDILDIISADEFEGEVSLTLNGAFFSLHVGLPESKRGSHKATGRSWFKPELWFSDPSQWNGAFDTHEDASEALECLDADALWRAVEDDEGSYAVAEVANALDEVARLGVAKPYDPEVC